MALTEFEIYIHTDINIITISDFLSKKDSIAAAFKDNKDEFLDYDGGTGYSNLDRAYEMYTEQEKEDNEKNNDIELLKVNTEFLIPKTLLNKELLSISGKNQFLKQSNFKAFYGKSLLQLLKDPLYTPKVRFKYSDKDSLTYLYPYISVWIYVGALNDIINVTDYVMSCSIGVSDQGGTFSIILPPVISLDDENIYKSGNSIYSGNNIKNEILDKNNEFYFNKFIQTNDIVFIKFEKLEIEKEERLEDFVLNKSVLPNQIYDMIGLVNSNSKSTSYQNIDASITISGSDLMKLLIEDGSYFFPLLFTSGIEDTFVNLQDDDKLLKRTFVTGKYESLYAFSLRSISSTIQFIVNQLANLGVVGDDVDLFSSYGERRTKVYRLDNESDGELSEDLHIGIWQIIKLLVDDNVSDRRVADSSISQPDGSLITQFQKVCQPPFVEFFGDTYGDFYNFIVRQPPFTKAQILSFINGTATDINTITGQSEELIIQSDGLNKQQVDLLLTIDPDDIMIENLEWEGEQIYSWYEIRPQGSFIGSGNDISLAYIPIVYFPQYANKWGCRRLSAVSNYISYQALTGKDSDINRDFLKEAIINDYKYMMDSNVYLPFTRKGNIIINGDRRFKRGTWVRHGGTGEIYYVDAVSNDFSVNNNGIDRVTSLVLSRGMVERYTKGNITYFNIVDTDFIRDVLIERLTSGNQTKNKPRVNVKSNFGVNQEIFDFFYNRQQFFTL